MNVESDAWISGVFSLLGAALGVFLGYWVAVARDKGLWRRQQAIEKARRHVELARGQLVAAQRIAARFDIYTYKLGAASTLPAALQHETESFMLDVIDASSALCPEIPRKIVEQAMELLQSGITQEKRHQLVDTTAVLRQARIAQLRKAEEELEAAEGP